MLTSLRQCEIFLRATAELWCIIDQNFVQMWMQYTCWLIWGIICNHMTQSGDLLPSSRFWQIHHNLWLFSHVSIWKLTRSFHEELGDFSMSHADSCVVLVKCWKLSWNTFCVKNLSYNILTINSTHSTYRDTKISFFQKCFPTVLL